MMPMQRIEHELTLSGTAQAAWAVVGDLSRLASFDPGLSATELTGAAKDSALRVRNRDGRVWEERCTARERLRGWSLESDATTLPFPMRSLNRSLALHRAHDDRLVLRYSVIYTLKLGPLGALRLPRSHVSAAVRQTLEAMVHAIRAQQWRHDATVESILERKGREVITLAPGTTVRDAARQLQAHRIGAALVAEGTDLLGLVSERDIAYRTGERGADMLDCPVEDIMSRDLVVCSPEHDMEYVMLCMTERRIRHLPVLRNGDLVGIVSIGDVVRERIAALESQSQTMREYIESREWKMLTEPAVPSVGAAQPLGQP